jgi:histidinol dehydrogenase
MRINYFELASMSPTERANLCRRGGPVLSELVAVVAPMIEEVRQRGDDAVFDFTQRFDHVDMRPFGFRVKSEDMDRAVEELPVDLTEVRVLFLL